MYYLKRYDHVERAGYPVRRRMRLGDDFHWLGVSLEAILRIRRLRRSVCGAHGCSAPPPSSAWVLMDYISFTFSYKLRYFTWIYILYKMRITTPTRYTKEWVTLQNITFKNWIIFWEKFILLKNYYFISLKASTE